MKLKILFLFFVFSAIFLNGQEIKLNSGIVATAGIGNELNSVNISKWRIGEVHLIILQQEELNKTPDQNWDVISYPNPFKKILNLDFRSERRDEYTIQITDIIGKKVLMNIDKEVLPNEVIKLDLSNLISAIYLVSITPKGKQTKMVIKVRKY